MEDDNMLEETPGGWRTTSCPSVSPVRHIPLLLRRRHVDLDRVDHGLLNTRPNRDGSTARMKKTKRLRPWEAYGTRRRLVGDRVQRWMAAAAAPGDDEAEALHPVPDRRTARRRSAARGRTPAVGHRQTHKDPDRRPLPLVVPHQPDDIDR